LIEVNQGRDVWETILQPLPRGVQLVKLGSDHSKASRFKLVHDYYERGWVAHLKPFPTLEDQALSFPHTQFDDVLDAACLGLHWWLKDRPRPLVAQATPLAVNSRQV
jgi:phage terminase large subunit-like protein